MRTMRSAASACGALTSASDATATHSRPTARQARAMRTAISPRFAMSTRRMRASLCGVARRSSRRVLARPSLAWPAAFRSTAAAAMAGGFEAAVDRVCARWVGGIDRRPGLALLLVGVVTVGLAVYAALTLGVNADPRGLVNPDLPFQVRQRELTKEFQTLSDGILVVIDGDSPTAAARAADTLAAKLGKRSDVFAQVDVPGGGP